MKNKTKWTAGVLIAIAAACALFYLVFGSPVVYRNNQKLQEAVTSIEGETVFLNEIVPFEWDTLYTFSPYTTKAEIEEIIGFRSASVRENNINEGMVHLLFVNNRKVVASVLGYPDNLGYSISFPAGRSEISYAENAAFTVEHQSNCTLLKHK